MPKAPFEITATKHGTRALIRIIGEIGWDTNSETFRSQIDELVAQGVKDVHIYINSPGGSCFDAAEIVNILSVFKGNVTGEGGALVASAGTYIAVSCKTFEMPANGQFMIHKPSGGNWGTADQLESYIKLLKDIESEYYNTYKGIAKDVTAFTEKWNKGDYWMTAKEAKEQGFITSVKPKVNIDKEMATAIKACGSPIEIEEITENQPKTKNEMDLKVTALMLGLPESATEQEVKAKLEANAKAAADLEAMRTAQAQKDKEEKNAKVKAALDKAIVDKRIKADARPAWENMLQSDFENANKALEAISPIEKLSSQIVKSPDGKGATYKGKTFEQLQDESPELLAELENDNPEAFAELFADWQKRNSKKYQPVKN